MLNIMLKRAYNDLNDRIIDLNRYIFLDDITIEYKDFGTTYDDQTYTGGRVYLESRKIQINKFIFEREFKIANRYNIKSLRKKARELYYKCIKTIKHELIHLYLYEKYFTFTSSFGNILYYDESPIFIIYCILCDASIGDVSRGSSMYGMSAIFANFYRSKYGSDLFEINRLLRFELREKQSYDYFTAYSWFEKKILEYKDKGEEFLVEKQDKDVYEAIKNGIIDKLNFWEVMLKLDSEVC